MGTGVWVGVGVGVGVADGVDVGVAVGRGVALEAAEAGVGLAVGVCAVGVGEAAGFTEARGVGIKGEVALAIAVGETAALPLHATVSASAPMANSAEAPRVNVMPADSLSVRSLGAASSMECVLERGAVIRAAVLRIGELAKQN